MPTNSARTFADGVAVRAPDAAALEIIRNGAERIVEVSDEEIAEAIRVLFSDTHTLAEGAGPLLATLDRDDVATTIRTLNEITRRARGIPARHVTTEGNS